MTIDRRQRERIRQRGFTLAEATLAMVLLSIAAAGVLLPFASGASVQADGAHRTLGAMLAHDLIERITATPFDQIVATYNYTESQGQVTDASGATFPDIPYGDFSRTVSCQHVYVAQQADTAAACFVLATVQVHYRGQEIVTINRLISE